MTTERAELKFEYVQEAFSYTEEGNLVWKDRPPHHFIDEHSMKVFNSRQAGKPAGSTWNGYVVINFKSGRVGAHRIIFLIHHGYLPEEVDHIDGNPSNNRIENLRPATHSENLKNRKTHSTNSSGRKGVSWHKSSGKWAAHIRIMGKQKHLGIYSNFEVACVVRKKAEEQYYGEFCRG